jgi:glycosyltransferase involved in cell wall biosynthesis
MKTLGISMIVRNESEVIEKCLETIKDADEIVICDTGSEDNTIEICKRYTDKIYTDYVWQDDFAEARNYSLSKCTTDYVLIIDADEQLRDSIKGIKHILNGFMSPDNKLPYMGMLFDVKTEIELIESCRVLRRVPEIKWEGAVHNILTLNGSNEQMKARCYKTKFFVNADYSPAHMKDPDRSMRILVKQLEIDPLNTRYMYYLSREYISRRMDPANKDKVEEYLLLIISLLEQYESICFYEDWTNELADALYCLALAYVEMAHLQQNYSWWYKGVTAAVKSFMVLPSYKAPAQFMAAAMLEMPRGQKYHAAHEFWKFVASKCNNAGVLQIREQKK